jgi:hypothetical protein
MTHNVDELLRCFKIEDNRIQRGVKEEDFLVYFINHYLYPNLEKIIPFYSYKPINNDKILVFIHIPKTAGLSLYNIFLHVFGKEKLSPFLQSLLIMPFYLPFKYEVLWGHFLFDHVQYLPVKEKIIISFVRDPVQRLWSVYNFWKNFKSNSPLDRDFIVLQSKEKLPESFFTNPRIMNQLKDAMLIRLCGFSTYLNIKTKLKEDKIDQVREMIRNHIQKNFIFIGIQERFEESVKKMFEKLGLEIRLPDNILKTRVNVSKKESIPNEIIKILEDLTYLDRILYDEVINLFHGD